MKHIFSTLVENILLVLRDFNSEIVQKAIDLKSKAATFSPEDEEIKIGFVKEDILSQSIQIILDFSLNEFTINYLNSSKVKLDRCYTELQ